MSQEETDKYNRCIRENRNLLVNIKDKTNSFIREKSIYCETIKPELSI